METIVEAQKKTMLGIVNEIFANGKLVCPVEKEVGENETVIGEVDDYEKATFLAAHKVADDYNQIPVSAKIDGTAVDPNQNSPLINKTLDRLFWNSIKLRIGKEATNPDCIGIRKDWKIVAVPAEEVDFGMLSMHVCIIG
ncbi:MAG: hypothetical protein PHG95_02445 [Patescibacteria group bacterium]|nr:hypothetical protein [Patescibacteria group bacterium]